MRSSIASAMETWKSSNDDSTSSMYRRASSRSSLRLVAIDRRHAEPRPADDVRPRADADLVGVWSSQALRPDDRGQRTVTTHRHLADGLDRIMRTHDRVHRHTRQWLRRLAPRCPFDRAPLLDIAAALVDERFGLLVFGWVLVEIRSRMRESRPPALVLEVRSELGEDCEGVRVLPREQGVVSDGEDVADATHRGPRISKLCRLPHV